MENSTLLPLSGLVRGCGARDGAQHPSPVSVEGCPRGSARLHQIAVCALSFCFELPPSAAGGDQDAGRVQAGYGQGMGRTGDRAVLLVIQLQGMIINVHQCKRCPERTREPGDAV